LGNKPHETLVFRSSPALIRYDARGNGLSDRIIDEISFDAFVGDVETVADAAKVTRFALLGISQGCAVTALLPRVSVPTLVMHARDEARVPFEAGRRIAAGSPGARFVARPRRNHLFLETEPAFGQFLEQVRAFLGG
jgi:pimeloyl-ACP methyl ester carboxylesterase